MTRVLYDTNVVLDALMQREPFYSTSTAAMDVENYGGKIEGYIAGHAVTTVDYVLRKQVGAARSRTAIAQLLEKFKVATVSDATIRQALQSPLRDFEDAVCHAIALETGISVIVTRDIQDFIQGTITVMLPEVFCQSLLTQGGLEGDDGNL